MKRYDYLIVGSGLFGATFTHEAIAHGKTCLVVEKRDHIGGNIYTEQRDGVTVHRYGAHIFHTSDKRVWDFVNALTPCNRYTNSPIANFKGELYNLPFNMNTFHQMWGVNTPQQAAAKIEEQCAEITGEPKNLEEQAIRLVGRDIYEKLIKGYTEKQWGKDCKDLPSFIIRRLPVRFTYDNNYFNDAYQGIPCDGYTALIQRLLAGADVRLSTDFLENREELTALADTVVYTGTIDSYFAYCYGNLEYRSLRFETETLDVENYQGVAVMNFTDRETPYTRVIEHKHFAECNSAKTVVTREYSAVWKQGDEPYYPVNDEKNQQLYAKYAALAQQETGVIFGGRLAEYRYYDMDKVIASALSVTDHLFKGENDA